VVYFFSCLEQHYSHYPKRKGSNELPCAEQLGVALGQVLYFAESYQGATPPMPMIRTRGAVMMAAGAPELPPGETEIQASVTVVFEIE